MYYIYRNTEHVGSFETEDDARQWVLSRINAARQLGAKGHPEYKLCWNGTQSVTLVTWPQTTFAELDARIARITFADRNPGLHYEHPSNPQPKKDRTMRETKAERSARFYRRMEQLGFSYDEASTLRRIEMTLQRWSEGECGDSDNYASKCIERDEATGKTYWVIMPHDRRPSEAIRHRIPDRETGALKRLTKIMAVHPDLWHYHQSDPRGCALYVGRKAEMNGDDINANYTRGVAVCI